MSTFAFEPLSRNRVIGYLVAGALAGYLSGLFGIGGGILIVPALVFLGLNIKVAAPTSLAAVLPISLVGTLSYGFLGHVDWLIAALLSLGSVTGAQIGARILGRLSRRTLQLAFSVFLLLVAASLFLVIPSRDAVVELTPLLAIGAVGVGLLVGTFASVLGIGGGVMIIPALVVGFGASDLVARGTAIAMMVPTSLSGTISHVRAGRADLRVAALVAAPAIVTTGMGVVSAQAISPFWGAILFAALLTVVAAQLAWRVRRPE